MNFVRTMLIVAATLAFASPTLAAGNYSNDPNGSWPREGCR